MLTFGSGSYGRLGHGDEEDQLLPKVVEALRGEEVLQISAGIAHSAVLREDGEVLTFGFGGNNRLGHGDNANQLLPKAVASLRGTRVAEVVAGHVQTAVLTETGALLTLYVEPEEEGDGFW